MGFTLSANPGAYVAPTVPLVMFAWIPIVLYLFSRFPAQRALVISVITAWLFLPEAELSLPGIPDYTKLSATSYGVLLATFIFDVGRFTSFRYRWIDVPMTIFCICPLFSSLSNDLGLYDGFAAMVDQTMTWGAPYFLGRIYMNKLSAMRQMAVGIFIGGLTYIPLCLFETRFSPQLHRMIYGSHAFGDFGQSIRLGGFRPTVFMRHGLAVAAFMMAATVIGIWLWRSGTIKQIWGIPMHWLVAAQFLTFLLLRSTGAYFLLLLGLGLLFAGKHFRTALPVFALIGLICAYLYVSAETSTYFTDQIIEFFSRFLPADRIQSLEFRFNNEELLTDRARERIWLGWGGYGRNLVPVDPANPNGPKTIVDSLWIIVFGTHGTVGLVSLMAALLLPVTALFAMRYPARTWGHPQIAPVAVLAMVVILYKMDCLVNALVNPVFVLIVGGVAGLVLKPDRIRPPKPVAQLVRFT